MFLGKIDGTETFFGEKNDGAETFLTLKKSFCLGADPVKFALSLRSRIDDLKFKNEIGI